MSNKFLYSTAFTAALLGFSVGTSLAWTSPVLPKLTGKIPDSSPFFTQPITKLEESWITSLLGLGSIFGPSLSGLFLDKIGRRKIMITIAILITLSYFLLAFAPTIEYMYVSRFVLGIMSGSVALVMPVYLSEIAKNTNRGSVILTYEVMLNLGSLMSYAVGPYVSVKILSLVCLLPLVVFLICVWVFVPESPYFFALTHNKNGVVHSLVNLRQSSADSVQEEASIILENVHLKEESKSAGLKIFKQFGDKTVLKSLALILLLKIFHQMSGYSAVIAYMQSIFIESGSKIPTDISTIIIGVIQCFSIILTSCVVDKFGRKILLSGSSFFCFLSLLFLGLYFYLKERSYNVEPIFWLPITALLSFTIAFRLGLGPLPGMLMAELFPPNIKSLASVISMTTSSVFIFLVTLMFPILSKFGVEFLFWCFSGCCAFCFVFVVLFVPETKGKSFQEIQTILNGKR